MSVVLNYKVR